MKIQLDSLQVTVVVGMELCSYESYSYLVACAMCVNVVCLLIIATNISEACRTAWTMFPGSPET